MDPYKPETWPTGHWYRNGTSGAFHHEAPDWVRTGKALCGRRIKNPGYTVSNPSPLYTLCHACLKKQKKP